MPLATTPLDCEEEGTSVQQWCHPYALGGPQNLGKPGGYLSASSESEAVGRRFPGVVKAGVGHHCYRDIYRGLTAPLCPHNILLGWRLVFPHFTDEQVEAREGRVT